MIHVHCVQCSQLLRVQEIHLGQNVRCGKCGNVFRAVASAIPSPTIPTQPPTRGNEQIQYQDEIDPQPRSFIRTNHFTLTLSMLALVVVTLLLIWPIVTWRNAELERQRQAMVNVELTDLGKVTLMALRIGLIVPPCVFLLSTVLILMRFGYYYFVVLRYAMFAYSALMFLIGFGFGIYMMQFRAVPLYVSFTSITIWLCSVSVFIVAIFLHFALSEDWFRTAFGMPPVKRKLRA